MYSKYFVLITENEFGVFNIVDYYPSEFLENINCVTTVSESDLKRFLISNLGRNILINKNFDPIYSIGKIFSRKPN